MKRPRTAQAPRYSLFDRLEAALVTVVWALLPCMIVWFAFNYWMAGTAWQIGGPTFLKILLGAAILGFAFPRAIPGFVGWLWDGILRIGYWLW